MRLLSQTILGFVLAGLTETLGAVPSITISFGKPTYIEALCYTTLYSAKPYKPAIVFLYDNGMYKILSPGESHYGTYLTIGKTTDSSYVMNYMALPSKDWGDATVWLELTYHPKDNTFSQNTHLLNQATMVPTEAGNAQFITNTVKDPRPLTWKQVEHMKSIKPLLMQCGS